MKAVTVDGVEASEATVQDGTYTIQRPFVFVTKKGETLSDAAQAFIDFAISGDAGRPDCSGWRCASGEITRRLNMNRKPAKVPASGAS